MIGSYPTYLRKSVKKCSALISDMIREWLEKFPIEEGDTYIMPLGENPGRADTAGLMCEFTYFSVGPFASFI